MARVVQGLATLGYVGRYGVLRASDAGAPHARARVFIVARPAADATDGGRHELHDGREPRAHDPQPLGGRTGLAGDNRGSRLAAADTERGAGDGRADEPVRGPDRGTAAVRDSGAGGGGDTAADTDSDGRGRCPERDLGPEAGLEAPYGDDTLGRVLDWGPDADGRGEGTGDRDGDPERDVRELVEHFERAVNWGPYAAAITRWEPVLGRLAPRPTEPGRTGQRLSPKFVEFLMGLPDGWVTAVPGLSRNAQLKALGNGVVPQQAALALAMLLDRADIAPLVAEGAA